MTSVAEVGHVDHAVMVYDHDAELLGALSEFVQAGLAAGDACVVVVTPTHRNSLEHALADAGWDVAAARASGQYVAIDASETLARLMVDGAPDRDAFRSVVTPLVAGPGPARRVRIYSEMVALLWAEGDVLGALALEELWHELIAIHPFGLLCSYPAEAFAGQEGSELLRQVCGAHETVVGGEAGMPPAAAAATDTLTVLLVDPHALVLAGLAALVSQETDLVVADTVSTVEAAVAAARRNPPDVVVFDPDMDVEGFELVSRLHGAGLDPATVALTGTDEASAVRRALAAGVTSYVLKQARSPVVVDAIRQTAAGTTVLPPELVFQLATTPSAGSIGHETEPTVQERRLLQHLSEGMTNAQIAQQPDMPSVRTVQKHMENLSQKLGAHNRVGLIVAAHRRGLLP